MGFNRWIVMSEQTVVFTDLDRLTAEQLELSELARTGVPGQARVLDVRELWPVGVLEGTPVGARGRWGVVPALFLDPVTPPALARVQDGGSFAARVDPHRPERVYVHWLG
jgi:hypothetical protein